MSKKKFTDGLEDLFGPSFEEGIQDGNPFLTTTVEEKVGRKEKSTVKKSRKRKASGKNFTSDLESLFQHALTEAIDESSRKLKGKTETQPKTQVRRIRRRPVSGLDSLIRQTITTSRVDIETGTKKRVTFVFDKSKLAKLKRIAKVEKAYLKDIIGSIVEEYISSYEQSHGAIVD
ncbi:MAG: hypothetical protein AAFP19_14860 [Bacteroidota bacterium]